MHTSIYSKDGRYAAGLEKTGPKDLEKVQILEFVFFKKVKCCRVTCIHGQKC